MNNQQHCTVGIIVYTHLRKLDTHDQNPSEQTTFESDTLIA